MEGVGLGVFVYFELFAVVDGSISRCLVGWL